MSSWRSTPTHTTQQHTTTQTQVKMKKSNFFKLAAMAVAAVFTMSMASCSDDDEEKGIRCNPSSLTMEVGTSAKVMIKGGTQPYTVKSSDENTATVKVSKDTLFVTSVKEGKATVAITDAAKLTTALPVNVVAKTADVTFDKTSSSVAVGKDDVVTIKTGTSPYTVTVKDSKIATASVKDSKVTIKGVKAGTTTVTVTDKNKKAGVITVTVK